MSRFFHLFFPLNTFFQSACLYPLLCTCHKWLMLQWLLP
ncbi:molybdenum cofactor biosynthesis protein C [Listeria monocytogenes]|nr:molybdenum cofactor biosynthesis protein C [Listeria monocytogenes]GAT39504.1 molybdenum cofactor biosynthesis protein C [Listeria monocytogenes]